MNSRKSLFFLLFGVSILHLYSYSNNRFSGEVVEKQAVGHSGNSTIRFIHDPSLYMERWDTLVQPLFWKKIITLSQDSCLINVSSSRQVLGKMAINDWRALSETQKNWFRDSLRQAYELPDNSNIYITTGKKEFYNHKLVIPEITRAVNVFNDESVDPWYAQVILLIESPGRMQKSTVGAYGAFQLMKSVARKFGLKINKYVDERSDFDKSAMAAARLIGRICVPEVKKMLDNRNISYQETDLWFRILVLHAYHAGSGNVAAVISKIDPCEGGMALITKMWTTEAGGFKNASQNYSQIGLASLMRFDELVYQDKGIVFIAEGDKWFNEYKINNYCTKDTLQFLNSCIQRYEEDLLNGVIPADYFISKIKLIDNELVTICISQGCSKEQAVKKSMDFKYKPEQLTDLGYRLIRARKNAAAVDIFKYCMACNPSTEVSSGLSEATKALEYRKPVTSSKRKSSHTIKKKSGKV